MEALNFLLAGVWLVVNYADNQGHDYPLVRMKYSMLLVSCSAALISCTGGGPPVITLGAAGPWKAGYGRMNRLGIELAVAEMNAHGGLQGRKIEVIERDDDGNGGKAAEIAEEFVDNHTISGVIGHVNSGAMVAAAKVYDNHLVALATTASSPDLTGISPWIFRVISSDSTNGRDIARFATRLGRQRSRCIVLAHVGRFWLSGMCTPAVPGCSISTSNVSRNRLTIM